MRTAVTPDQRGELRDELWQRFWQSRSVEDRNAVAEQYQHIPASVCARYADAFDHTPYMDVQDLGPVDSIRPFERMLPEPARPRSKFTPRG